MEEDICSLNNMRVKFHEKLKSLSTNPNCALLSREKYNRLVRDVKNVELLGKKKPADFWLMRHYAVLSADGGVDKLIHPVSSAHGIVKYYVHVDDLFDVLYQTHISVNHGGRDKMLNDLNKRYKNVTQSHVMCFLQCCESCGQKRNAVKKNACAKPALFKNSITRCQIHIIDFQQLPDGEYKFVFVYQDCPSEFIVLRPLTSNSAEEVADNLLDVFSLLGVPCVLQSDYGHDFCKSVIDRMKEVWPDLYVVSGELFKSESEGGILQIGDDIRNLISTWMAENVTTQWSKGLRFVQFIRNGTIHPSNQKSPYEAMFPGRSQIGLLNLALPQHLLDTLYTEEELIKSTESMTDVEDTKIFLPESTLDFVLSE